MIGRGDVETVSDELDAVGGEPLLPAHVPREVDPLPVVKRPCFVTDFHRDGRMAGAFHAEHADRLEVLTGITGWRDSPGPKMFLDVAASQAQARRIGIPPL